MKRTIEIDDTLQERVESACDDLKCLMLEWFAENTDADKAPDLSDLDYSGGVHEIVDSSVPIYTHEIESTWYLYSDRLEESYENMGIGDNPRENSGMIAIYAYIWDRVCEWYDENSEELFKSQG